MRRALCPHRIAFTRAWPRPRQGRADRSPARVGPAVCRVADPCQIPWSS